MHSKVLFLIAALGLSGSVLAEVGKARESALNTSNTGYVLSVDTNAPGSVSLVEGRYDDAIKSAQRAIQLGKTDSAWLTLCAAYIGKVDLAAARGACDEAVSKAQSPITTARLPHGHRDRDGLAKAYSNRAILNVLLGDADAARADLDQAARQNRHAEVVRRNQRRLQSATLLAERR